MTDKKPIIIITGSNGFVGAYLVSHFAAADFHVRAFQRGSGSQNDPRIRYYSFALDDVREEGFIGADYLVHTAYEQKDSRRNKDVDINVTGTKTLLSLCRKHGVKPIFLSTLSAHPEAESSYGRTKLKMEALFDTNRDLILKLGLVLGRGGLPAKIGTIMKTHKLIPLLGGGNQLIQAIPLPDLAQVIMAGVKKNLSGNFAIAHPTPLRMKDLYAKIADVVGARPIFVPLPLSLTFYLLSLAEMLGLHPPISSENVLGLKQLKVFDTKKDLEAFGVTIKDCDQTLADMTLV